MKAVLIGSVQFSRSCLVKMIAMGMAPVAVVTRQSRGSHADFAAMDDLCGDNGIAFYRTDDINAPDTVEWIATHEPDVILCFGWSQLLRRPLLDVAKLGVIGYHPSLLPLNRGHHPLIWALALGLPETGSTFFEMAESADSGMILSQESIRIAPDDDANTLYQAVTETALRQLEELLPAFVAGTCVRRPQDHAGANSWRRRGPSDGRIDWRMSSRGIYDLVRALTRPYPGATALYEGKDCIVWRARVDQAVAASNLEPGKVLLVAGQEVTVRTGDGAVTLIDHEIEPLPRVGAYFRP